ncbi:hypothetical protein Q4544_01360 [Cognatishimia sp. 1_MG-2023]|nr:hypothetical protein [Cognatishimia sp. 1_MG-2023]
MMMRGTILVLLVAAVAVSACGRLKKDTGLRFDEQRFRIKASKVSKEDRSKFIVSVAPASATLDGAREAALYGGTEYCIQQYGTSVIAWAHGPEDEPRIDGDKLFVEGVCKP